MKKPKEKCDEKDDSNETNKIMSIINELQIKSSMNAIDIHKLYIENQELKCKLDRIYANDLNEDINFYRNIQLMNEKIEYMQKYILHKGN